MLLVSTAPLPLIQFGKFNGILIIERRKIELNIYLPNILNLQPRTMGSKAKHKEIESDGPNESPKKAQSVKR